MSRVLSIACLAAMGMVLAGCGTKLENALRNPKVDDATWKAEQEYFVQRLEEFCFDRRWDEAPLEMTEMRGQDYGYRYRLWGEITDDYALPDVSEKRYRLVCRVVASLPFLQVTLHDKDPVRSSPWWNSHRRAAFKQRLTDRFGVLYSATKPRVDRFDGEMLLLRDGETVLEISHFKKNSGTSVQVYRRRAEPVEAVADPDDLPFGAERTRFFLRDGDRTRRVEVYHYEGVEDELPLNQVLHLDQLPPEAVVALDEERQAMDVVEQRRLRDQVAYNLERIEREVGTASFRHESEIKHRREMAAFERRLEAERKAANQALLQDVVTGLYQASVQSQSSGVGTGSSSTGTSSGSSASADHLYSPQVPWASIREQAAQARQQIQANHDAEQARQRAATSAGAVTSSGPSRAGTAPASSSRTASASSPSPDAPVPSRTPSKPDSADRAQTESNSKRELQRIYEPAPEVIVGTTDTYFGDRDLAIFQARLGAALDVDEICWDKGARSDRPTSADIRAGNVPPRWSMANPDCKQNSNGKWKCRTRVSGTCYRMQ
jgi:hypothetical protein